MIIDWIANIICEQFRSLGLHDLIPWNTCSVLWLNVRIEVAGLGPIGIGCLFFMVLCRDFCFCSSLQTDNSICEECEMCSVVVSVTTHSPAAATNQWILPRGKKSLEDQAQLATVWTPKSSTPDPFMLLSALRPVRLSNTLSYACYWSFYTSSFSWIENQNHTK